MKIAITVLIVLAAIVVLLLLMALFMKKEYSIRREIVINAPKEKVFDYLKRLKNQDAFNKWVMADPGMKRDFRGTDGTAGFVYAWNGNDKTGEGEQEIRAVEEGRRIETEIRFVRPFVAVAHADFHTDPVPGGQTKVTWSNKSVMKYPMNIMVPVIEKGLAKDMDMSLSNLKTILEKQSE